MFPLTLKWREMFAQFWHVMLEPYRKDKVDGHDDKWCSKTSKWKELVHCDEYFLHPTQNSGILSDLTRTYEVWSTWTTMCSVWVEWQVTRLVSPASTCKHQARVGHKIRVHMFHCVDLEYVSRLHKPRPSINMNVHSNLRYVTTCRFEAQTLTTGLTSTQTCSISPPLSWFPDPKPSHAYHVTHKCIQNWKHLKS